MLDNKSDNFPNFFVNAEINNHILLLLLWVSMHFTIQNKHTYIYSPIKENNDFEMLDSVKIRINIIRWSISV